MRYLKIPFLLIWRAWFYILMVITILIMLPFLFILTSKQSYYPVFWKMVRVWAKVLVYGMGFRLDIKLDEKIQSDKSYMFCANHGSMMDPFVLILLSKNPIVFVGKKEFVKIPIFGFFYKRAVIMVDRSSREGKKRVYKMAKERLKDGTSMAIFPEGLVPTEDVILAPFKNGAFSLAIEFEIPIVPQLYFDCKRFFSWDFMKGGPGVFRIHQFPFLNTKGLTQDDVAPLKEKTYSILYRGLTSDKKYMKDTNRLK